MIKDNVDTVLNDKSLSDNCDEPEVENESGESKHMTRCEQCVVNIYDSINRYCFSCRNISESTCDMIYNSFWFTFFNFVNMYVYIYIWYYDAL